MIKRRTIIDACDTILDYKHLEMKEDGTTFCNFGIDAILRLLGVVCFFNKKKDRLMMANEMVEFMEGSERFTEIPFEESIDSDDLIILGLRKDTNGDGVIDEKDHGHVAIVYPTGTNRSGKWGCVCPLVANIGPKNGVMGANYAFGMKPQAFRYNV